MALYRSVGEELAHYEVDVDGGALVKRAAVMLPANVQYAWPHPSGQYLYVASSNSGPGSSGIKGDIHRVSAFRIDAATGALQPHGQPQPLPSRPIHISLDATGAYALIAYNNPSGVTVHRINRDGTIGAQVNQPGPLDSGIFAHQVLMTPSNRMAILVTRGNDAAGGKAEDPGALKLFRFKDGELTNLASIAPGGGYGFGPRHLDFHPTQPWVYASIERQNKLHVYRLQGDGLAREPEFVKDTLAEPHNERPRQLGGAIHVHPNGRFVYVSNRADSTAEFEGKRVFRGGENSIAVYSINPATGEPTLIQHADTHGFHVRTFALDPGGRMLVAASIVPLPVREGSGVNIMPAGLSVFRIGNDGKLDFVRKYDVETGNKTQFWMGIVEMKADGKKSE
ncbi:MAG: 3-carboxymuconate cyclase [Betaproteobacteria bacterium RIFCSPLOWO2_02_FULL_62_79]|nr:MAG: 3-carboxymuconate cyclase [Betaproteobacteria bacterium RIFCSPLOWO2_02_FULL_62_79]